MLDFRLGYDMKVGLNLQEEKVSKATDPPNGTNLISVMNKYRGF